MKQERRAKARRSCVWHMLLFCYMNNPHKGFASALLVIVLVIIGGAAVWWTTSQESNVPTDSETTGLPTTQQGTSTGNQVTPQPTTVTFNVYFGEKDDSPDTVNCSHAVVRTIPYTPAVAQAALVELFKGPTVSEKQQGYYGCFFHTDIVVRSLKVENGIATANLSKEYDEGCGGALSCAAQSRSAVTNTLMQFPTVKSVQIQIEGIPRYPGEEV